MKLLLKCNPGLEDITVIEAKEEYGDGLRTVEVRRGRGRILLETDSPSLRPVFRLRSIHSAALLTVEETVGYGIDALRKIEEAAKSSGIHKYIPQSASFAVRAERIGEGHEYTSMDVARIVGKAVQDAYREEYGYIPEVRLESPSISVMAEVDGEVFRLGVYLVGEWSGHRRGYRVYDHPASLKPTIAYGLLRLAGARDSSIILDPMCGGGTVAIEAALLFEESRIMCVDKNPRHVMGAVRNSAAARVQDRIEFMVGDARRLEELVGTDIVDYVASNPPYGIRLGDPTSVRKLYSKFIPSLYKVMRPGGRASIVTTESNHAISVAGRTGFRITHIRKIRHGDLWVSLIVFEKPE